MNLNQTIETYVDLKIFRQCFFALAAGCLLILPLTFFMTGKKTVIAREHPAPGEAHDVPVWTEDYGQILAVSALFGKRAAVAQIEAEEIRIEDLMRTYSLKGIALTGDPEAIVQDLNQQKMFFVKIGDSLGPLKIKEIAEGKIIVSYQNQEGNLSIE